MSLTKKIKKLKKKFFFGGWGGLSPTPLNIFRKINNVRLGHPPPPEKCIFRSPHPPEQF